MQSVSPSDEHLRHACAPHLEPGEEIRQLFSGVLNISKDRWIVAVTDRSILVVEASPGTFIWQPLRLDGTFRLPRTTRIGPRHGSIWYALADTRFRVAQGRDQWAIAEADAAIGFPAT